MVLDEGGAVAGLHAKVQGGRDLDVARVATLGAARIQLGGGALSERVSLQRHTCSDRRPPGANVPKECYRLPPGRVHVQRTRNGSGALALPDVAADAHPLHEVSSACAGEQAGDTRLPQGAEGLSDEYALCTAKLSIFI